METIYNLYYEMVNHNLYTIYEHYYQMFYNNVLL